MHEKGMGVEQSFDKARKWYQIAYEAGNRASTQDFNYYRNLFRLGQLLEKGLGGDLKAESANIYFKLAEEGIDGDPKNGENSDKVKLARIYEQFGENS